ncbi:MAG: cation:proton antiporter, partial [Thermoplasmatota archaeon]
MLENILIEDIEGIRLLFDLAVILFAALIFGYIASKLKQPVILGYILAGITIGPYALGLVGKVEDVHVLAQIGVTLLLFVVGLEFSPKIMKKIWKVSVFGGIVEMTFIFLLGLGIGMFFNLGVAQSVFLGSILAISSTIVVIQVLQNLGEERELAGRIMIGLLIVQDVGVIIIVALLSNIFLVQGNDVFNYISPIILTLAFVALLLLMGRTVLPIILDAVSAVEDKTLFLIIVLVMSLGTASLAYMLGIPLALGSFLAGLVLAESKYGLEIVDKIRPLRDIFVVIFFVSVGMSLNIFLASGNLFFILVLIVVMVGGKFAIFALSSKIFGYTTKTAFKVGLGLIQIGEFSFIMAELGYLEGVITSELYSSVVIVALVTIMITPYSITKSDHIYDWFRNFERLGKLTNRLFPSAAEKKISRSDKELKDHVVLIGYGTVGHLTVDSLIKARKPFIIIDHDPSKIPYLEELNFPYIYGDATSTHILEKANVDKADMVVETIPGERDTVLLINEIRKMNPDCDIIARVHSERLKDEIEEKVHHIIYPEAIGGKAVVEEVERMV